jgi:hypothetical protein
LDEAAGEFDVLADEVAQTEEILVIVIHAGHGQGDIQLVDHVAISRAIAFLVAPVAGEQVVAHRGIAGMKQTGGGVGVEDDLVGVIDPRCFVLGLLDRVDGEPSHADQDHQHH